MQTSSVQNHLLFTAVRMCPTILRLTSIIWGFDVDVSKLEIKAYSLLRFNFCHQKILCIASRTWTQAVTHAECVSD